MKNPANLENVLSKINSLKEDNNNKKIYTYYNEIKNNPEFFLGNKNGETIIIEFFDYNCGYCKRSFPTIMDVMAEDKKVNFVFVELPILS
jgi:protein-disulfide isomerase